MTMSQESPTPQIDDAAPDLAKRLALVHQLGEVVEQMVWRSLRQGTEQLRPYDLTMPQALALRVVGRFGPDLEMTHLAEISGLPASSITSIMDRLVRRELVDRHAHPTDRRRVTATVTPQGRALLAHMDRQGEASLRWLASAFSAEEIALLIRLFEQWNAHQEASQGPSPDTGA